MSDTTATNTAKGFSRLKLFFALSRTPHGLLDMVTPILGALLWFDGFPSIKVSGLGIMTVFSGYTAVYALNDVVDYRTDKEKAKLEGADISGDYLDAILIRHPLAQGVLSYREGLMWAIAWSILALIGAFLLNPVCALIFIFGCILEITYCLMLKVSYFRTIISGIVKTCGCIAAVFAVDPHPSPLFLLVLFSWLFAWEIGGQNIPADWVDTDVDRTIHAQTIPVRFGSHYANIIILGLLTMVLLLNSALLRVSPITFSFPFVFVAMISGVYSLIYPAFKLYRTRDRQDAIVLFNRASYYPMAILIITLIRLLSLD